MRLTLFLVSTALDLMGLAELEDPDGTSLVPEIELAAAGTSSDGQARSAVAHLDSSWSQDPTTGKPIVALNWDRWRLIWDARIPTQPKLFDKLEDPQELRDIASREPSHTRDLVARVEAYLDDTAAPWGESAAVIEIDDMQLQQLRAIGYGVP